MSQLISVSLYHLLNTLNIEKIVIFCSDSVVFEG